MEGSSGPSQRDQNAWTVRRSHSRSPSPPPPPPPPLDSSSFLFSPFSEAEKAAQDYHRRAPEAKPSRPGSFPFLKKNSRKEPSAANKKNPSPTKKTDPEEFSSPAFGSANDKATRTPQSSRTRRDTNGKPSERVPEQFDILLSGKDYWGLDNSIVDDIRAEVKNKGSGLTGTQTNSDKKETRSDMNYGNQLFEAEIAEFERLETAVSQSKLKPEIGNEYHLAKKLEMSQQATSQHLKPSVTSSSHSRLLSQSLARAKSTDSNGKNRGGFASSFGYQRGDDEDEDEDGSFDRRLSSSKYQDAPSSNLVSRNGNVEDMVVSERPKPTFLSKPLVRSMDFEDQQFRRNNEETVKEDPQEVNVELSFDFDDLPRSNARKYQAPPPPYAVSLPINDNNSSKGATALSRLERPSSTLKVDNISEPGHGGTRQGRSKTPQAHHRNGTSRTRSNSVGRPMPSAGNNNASNAIASKEMEQKMHSLQAELDHYKNENASIKKLKKQQEQALAETVQRKEEVLKYLEDERQRTLTWCAEQRAEVEKEKRSAAKQIRETKQKTLGTTAPIKTQKAEIEALQATIEKMKSTHDTAARKWKTTENRLYALIHEHSDHIENLEKQLLSLEENRISLLEFIAQSGLRIPKSLQSKVIAESVSGTSKQAASTSKSTLATGPSIPFGRVSAAAARQQALQQTVQRIQQQHDKEAHKGYMEEVDVEVIEVGKSSHLLDLEHSHDHEYDTLQSTKKQVDKKSFPVTTTSTTIPPAFVSGSGSGSNPTTRRSSTSSNTTTVSSSSAPAKSHLHGSQVGSTVGISMNDKTMRHVTSSWARSSRSSGRYSQTSEDLDDFFEDEDDMHMVNIEDREEVQLNAKSKENSNKNGLESTRRAVDDAFADLIPSSTRSLTAAASSGVSPSTSAPHPHNDKLPDESGSSNRTEQVRPDGTRVIHYRNGTVKEVDAQGNQKIRFANGDRKYSDAQSGAVIYFYAENQTTHTTYVDGVELLEFPNGQVERHFPTGKKEVMFPDQSKKVIHPDGLQESIFPDGVRLLEYNDGRREVLPPSSM